MLNRASDAVPAPRPASYRQVDVNGLTADSLWANIRAACASPVDVFDWAPSTWVPVTPRDVAWNFESVLFGKDGMPFRRYATAVDPSELADDITFLQSQ